MVSLNKSPIKDVVSSENTSLFPQFHLLSPFEYFFFLLIFVLKCELLSVSALQQVAVVSGGRRRFPTVFEPVI